MVTSLNNTSDRGRDLLEHGIAAIEYSACGMLLMRGGESIDFLHRISTNDVKRCVPGTAMQTAVVSEKAKIVDAVTIVNTTSGVLVLTSPGMSGQVKSWLERFIIMEDIAIEDVTGRYASALVLGDAGKLQVAFPRAASLELPTMAVPLSVHFTFFSLSAVLVLAASADALMATLAHIPIPIVTRQDFDEFRISRGIPEAGKEIVPALNPLEAGLKPIVSFTKGCYIGQEVIARLETYKKVQKFLCRVVLTPCPGAEMSPEIIGEDGIHGYITTIVPGTEERGECTALAILRSPAIGAQFTSGGGAVDVRVEHIFD